MYIYSKIDIINKAWGGGGGDKLPRTYYCCLLIDFSLGIVQVGPKSFESDVASGAP